MGDWSLQRAPPNFNQSPDEIAWPASSLLRLSAGKNFPVHISEDCVKPWREQHHNSLIAKPVV